MAANQKRERGATDGALANAPETPRSLAHSEKGIKTANDFANLMSALMSDLLDGRVTPSIGNATCNAGGKLLKVVEMQYKYGTQGPGQNKTLLLAVEDEGESNGKR
jgi:hypothetical protein